MGKKPKAAAKAPQEDEEAPEGAVVLGGAWTCECEYENEPDAMECAACEAARPKFVDPKFENFVVGLIQTVAAVPGKDKLKVVEVDVGEEKALQIVTNAGNVKEGSRVVVAKVGAIVNDEPIKKGNVGGQMSEGMLCDGPMLGWTGGGAGAAALLPDSFEVGGPPPDQRPRGDGK
eukprot:CAMPEP_0194764180 /NCGR_PEP_ID=MMETSP0323_2-20130528/21496_1 /TAXON_ID=2866 ORGANISM="Crypthecodinium cohnii, Strain Seligo" /NCGR_SAMPLE_ID=MMETSP0323_2 /ASSEMBLY_ACC=CAM_ASM_000346 /LENGTH=174 /DNA_ID=CAMNT_0039690715 /DNA_START=65 /DNA_END=589 /DNA_ORIENTATION=+